MNGQGARQALSHLQAADPRLAAVIARVGRYRMQYRDPDFRSLARSIVFQQLNGRAAGTIFDRLEQTCGGRGVTAAGILALRPGRMRSVGLSNQKTTYLRELARHTRDRKLDFQALPALTDEAVIEHLTQVKGIGVWTAHMFLMFALRRPDVLPVGDYGVRLAMRRLYEMPDLPKPADMERQAAPWRPWRSVASWYLWRSLDAPVEL
jgi:DNA-3-methyladenine glycosylase II